MGLAASIGISNFNSQQIERLLQNARIKPVTNQVEVHPYFSQKKLIDFCSKRDIWVTAYGPLGLQIPLKDSKLPKLVENPKIVAIANEVKKTPAQVILRYLVRIRCSLRKSFDTLITTYTLDPVEDYSDTEDEQ